MGVKGWAGGKGKGEAEGRLSCPVAAATMCGHTLEAQTSREPTPQSQAPPWDQPRSSTPNTRPRQGHSPNPNLTRPHCTSGPSNQHRAQPRPGCEPPESEPRADRPNISKKESEQGPPMPKTSWHNFDSNFTFRILGTHSRL